MVRALIILCLAAGSAVAGELPRFAGMYPKAGQPLPMLDSKVEIVVRGPLVEVIVTQRFTNRQDHATEATYIFPLPPDAAVSAMWIEAGTKTMRAKIAKRADALARYEEAVRAGVTASLLEQERPDIFTQTVTGIPARGTVTVSLRYDSLAHFYDGAWGLALPMVIAPRYVAGAATSRPTTGSGRAPDTDRAPDASRVTPGGAPGAGGATAVSITFADKVWDVTSPTHELAVAGGTASFTDPRSDHDAIIRWKAPNVAGWVEQGGFAAVVVEAPGAVAKKSTLRAMLVLDRSAASKGDADALAQPFVRQLLAALDGADRVSVAGSDALAWAPPQTIQKSLDRSWTQRSTAFDLTRVLATARPEGAPIILVTSGLVADDRAAVAAAKKLGVPVHVIGTGPAPARGLLAQIATATGGTARFLAPGDDLHAIARAVVVDAATPATPLTVSWGTLVASDVVPGTLPRLGAGQAILVLARVKKAQTANARAGGEVFAIEMLPAPRAVEGSTANVGPLGRRWARSRMDEMLAYNPNAAQVTAHALQYGLVSPYTSMVAVGEEVVVQGGTRRSVAVPVSVPSGMKWQAVKKETTVDTTKPEAPASEQLQQPAKPDLGAARTERPAKIAEADEERPKKKQKKDQEEKASEADDAEEENDEDQHAPSPVETSAISLSGASIGLARDGSPGTGGSRLRLTTSFAGGFAHSRGESAGLLVLGGRVEYATRWFLVGVDASARLVGGDDTQGRVMISFARFGLARYLEIGAAAGAHFGAGAGPAGSLSLRYHLPPAPRAAVVLRYDGAYLYRDDTSRGLNELTLGLEWGF